VGDLDVRRPNDASERNERPRTTRAGSRSPLQNEPGRARSLPSALRHKLQSLNVASRRWGRKGPLDHPDPVKAFNEHPLDVLGRELHAGVRIENGVDLRDRDAEPPADFALGQITKVAPGADCPLFLAFLARITDNGAALVSYLQRVLGYALTGLTTEHALFFAYGTGANGKSVFLSTVSGVLADYHKTAAPETFTVSHNDRHLSELARLRGARMVSVTETEEGRRWAESRIKQMTGGSQFHAAGSV
jgi:hypothetical protein